ncbi:protein of unknown function [Methylocaldum szegediense]|uniref:Uncharacterized protein n=1 Tax=Methylocaldum szegediense TaxID=73780 RepID=A0ABN8X2X4_9GAMM|nr:protein of unknown function [Methylocaldum szegediense]
MRAGTAELRKGRAGILNPPHKMNALLKATWIQSGLCSFAMVPNLWVWKPGLASSCMLSLEERELSGRRCSGRCPGKFGIRSRKFRLQ